MGAVQPAKLFKTECSLLESRQLAVIEGSGRIARTILDDYARPDEEARVLFLADAIKDGLPIVRSMTSTSETEGRSQMAPSMSSRR